MRFCLGLLGEGMDLWKVFFENFEFFSQFYVLKLFQLPQTLPFDAVDFV